jgi:hypothetical protein
MPSGDYAGLDAWARLQVRVVLRAHKRLTLRGWEPLNDSASAIEILTADAVSKLRAEMLCSIAIRDLAATLVALSLGKIPDGEGSAWVAQQAEQLLGHPVRLGPAVAAAIILGYEPLPWDCGQHCLFRERLVR